MKTPDINTEQNHSIEGIYSEDALTNHAKGSRLTAEEILTKMKKTSMSEEALSNVYSSDLSAVYYGNTDMLEMITDAYLLGFYKGRTTK